MTKKEKFNKQHFWEMNHHGLRVRIVAIANSPKLSVEVFDDEIICDTIFANDFEVGQKPAGVDKNSIPKETRGYQESVDSQYIRKVIGDRIFQLEEVAKKYAENCDFSRVEICHTRIQENKKIKQLLGEK